MRWGRSSRSGAARFTKPAAGDEKTVRIARRRFARRQWARRWLAWRRVLAASLGIGVVAGSIWLVFFSSALAVSGVRVEGGEVLDADEVRRAAAVPLGEPLATVNIDAVTARVESLAPVKSAAVSRAWPDRVRIAIEERETVAVVDRDGLVRGVDADGVIFREYPSPPEGVPLVAMGAQTQADALAEAATVVDVLPASLASRVAVVEVDTIDTISLRLHSGQTIIWGSADDSANKAKVIDVLLEQAASTYDVSVAAQPTIWP